MFIRFLILSLFGSVSAFAGENVQLINEQNYQQETNSGVVLVDFYGPWCGPCQRLGPVLDKVAKNMKGKVKIVKVNIDQSHALMKSHGVSGVPTMVLYDNGKEVGRLVGYRDQESVQKFILSKGSSH